MLSRSRAGASATVQDMLWSMLPFADHAHGVRQPRKAVATGVRLIIFGLGVCIAFMVGLAAFHLHPPFPVHS